MNAQRSLLTICGAALLLVLPHTAGAQLTRSTSKVGTTAAQFLKIGAGARALGMGGAQAAVTGDISSIYWNPAALSRIITNAEVTFNHAEWLADINYDFAAAVLPIGGLGTFGFSFILMGTPEEEVRTVAFPEGDGRRWDAKSLAIGLSYARNLTERFSIGMNAKFVREAIWSESATGFAFDLGTLYMSEIKGLNLGASISNFGTTMRLEGRDVYFNDTPGELGSGPQNIQSQYRTEDYPMPLQVRIGLAYEYTALEDFRGVVALDATVPNDNVEYLNTGLELSWRQIVFGRLGYKSILLDNSEQGLTWGLGIHYGITNIGTIKLDYGFADYGRLKNVQYLSLGLSL